MPPTSTAIQDWTPAALEAQYAELVRALPARDANLAAWEAFFLRWNTHKIKLNSEYHRRDYRMAQNTRDAEAETRLRFMREQLLPVMETQEAPLRRAFLSCDARPKLEEKFGKLLFAHLELAQAAFDPLNVVLASQEREIVSQYQTLLGQASLEVMGESLTLSQANARLTDSDGAVRRTAWEAIQAWLNSRREDIHGHYDGLVALRHGMALHLGEENFVPLGYRHMGRTDYGAQEVATFRAGILKHVTPLYAKLRAQQAENLGKAMVLPWDTEYYPGLSLGPQTVPVAGQLERAGKLFEALSPRLAAHFRAMENHGLIDLENRPGKRTGAFCTAFPDEGKVLILCNSTGSEADVVTLLHEMGHAFQGLESRDIVPLELKNPTLDACEVHSMGMEFLALKEISAFFAPDEARRFRRLKFIKTLTRLPYMALVDAFQHWVYENPEHSHADRENTWAELSSAYLPGIDTRGRKDAATTRWMRQPHIFATPFYYIDYALAELGALQLWQMSEADHPNAMACYLKLCQLGGTRSLLDFFKEGGLNSPFDPELLPRLMGAVAAELAL